MGGGDIEYIDMQQMAIQPGFKLPPSTSFRLQSMALVACVANLSATATIPERDF